MKDSNDSKIECPYCAAQGGRVWCDDHGQTRRTECGFCGGNGEVSDTDLHEHHRALDRTPALDTLTDALLKIARLGDPRSSDIAQAALAEVAGPLAPPEWDQNFDDDLPW